MPSHLHVNNNSFEIYLAAIFGVVGILWRLLECSPVPMLLGFVLGPMMEENLRRALQVARGDLSIFVKRPISLGFLIATVLIIIVMCRRCASGGIAYGLTPMRGGYNES